MSGGNGDQPNPGARAAASSGAAGGAQVAGAAVALLILAAGVLAPVWVTPNQNKIAQVNEENILISPEEAEMAVDELRLAAADLAGLIRSQCWNRGTTSDPDWVFNATAPFPEFHAPAKIVLYCQDQTDFAVLPESQGGSGWAYRDFLVVRGATAQPGEVRIQFYSLDYGPPAFQASPAFVAEGTTPCYVPVDADGVWVAVFRVGQRTAQPAHYLFMVSHPEHPAAGERAPEALVVKVDHALPGFLEVHDYAGADLLRPVARADLCRSPEQQVWHAPGARPRA